MSNISTHDYCVFNIFSKVRKVENIKYTIPTASPVKSLLFKYFFGEIVPYSSQDITYTTIVASVIFFLLSFLHNVNLQCSKHATLMHEEQATSFLCDENHNFEKCGRFLKRQESWLETESHFLFLWHHSWLFINSKGRVTLEKSNKCEALNTAFFSFWS